MILDSVKCIVENSKINEWADIATVVISFINLIFIVAIAFYDKFTNKKNKIIKYKYDWYKMIEVDKRIANLENLINDIKKELEKLCNSSEDNFNKRKKIMEKSIEKINNVFHTEKSIFSPLLKCINEDKNIYISVLYNEFEDIYMELFQDAFMKKNSEFNKLYEYRTRIAEVFYDTGINLIK